MNSGLDVFERVAATASRSTQTACILLFGLFLPGSGIVWAQSSVPNAFTKATKDTYCGSGITEPVVPDSLLGCSFSAACKAHDVCYGRCDPDGDRVGSDYCKLSELSPSRIAAKNKCDDDFYTKIVADNQNSQRCQWFASFYRSVVRRVGQGPFNGKITPQLISQLSNTSATPDEAAGKLVLLIQGDEKGLLDLANIQKRANSMVIPTKPAFNVSQNEIVLKKGLNQREMKELESKFRNIRQQ